MVSDSGDLSEAQASELPTASETRQRRRQSDPSRQCPDTLKYGPHWTAVKALRNTPWSALKLMAARPVSSCFDVVERRAMEPERAGNSHPLRPILLRCMPIARPRPRHRPASRTPGSGPMLPHALAAAHPSPLISLGVSRVPNYDRVRLLPVAIATRAQLD